MGTGHIYIRTGQTYYRIVVVFEKGILYSFSSDTLIIDTRPPPFLFRLIVVEVSSSPVQKNHFNNVEIDQSRSVII